MTNDQIAKSMTYKNTFASEHGKAVLEDLDKRCKYRTDMFVALSGRVTDFNLGMNDVIRYIHAQIERNLTEPEDKKAVHKEIQ